MPDITKVLIVLAPALLDSPCMALIAWGLTLASPFIFALAVILIRRNGRGGGGGGGAVATAALPASPHGTSALAAAP